MYLISVYFDEKTNRILNRYIGQIAQKTGNTFMLDHQVPPHITVSAIEARQGENLIPYVECLAGQVHQGEIQFVSVGALFPYVLYLTPVLNEYLTNLSQRVYDSVKIFPEGKISKFYRPFQWLPHVTLGKTLKKEQMLCAFESMQENFVPFTGKIVRLGLAKTNPHEDIWTMGMK